VGSELFDLSRDKTHVGNLSTSNSAALFTKLLNVEEPTSTDAESTVKVAVALRRPIEINEDLPLIVCKVAVRCGETNGVNLEGDPRLSLINAPALRAIRRVNATEAHHR
jgi:hypothetical protein